MAKDIFSDEPDYAYATRTADDSAICALLKGEENTLKTGIAMDCRSAKQIADHEKVYIIDPVNTAFPLWKGHWDGSPDFVIMNPVEKNIVKLADGKRKKEIDFEATFDNIYSFLIDIEEAMDAGTKVAGIIFEGIDVLNQDAAGIMREENDLDVEDTVQFRFWNIRNKYYNDVMREIAGMACPTYFTTHMKQYDIRDKVKLDKKGNPTIVGSYIEADMGAKTKDLMGQIVECKREVDKDGATTYTAFIEEFKSNASLVGQTFTTMTTDGDGSFDFKGLGVLRDPQNVENRQEMADLF